MSQDPKRAEYIKALHQLADWLEANPQAPVPRVKNIIVPLTTNTRVEDTATALGLLPVYDEDGNASITLQFGPLAYRPYGYADFAEYTEKHDEYRARTWADKKQMVIRPAGAEGGESRG